MPYVLVEPATIEIAGKYVPVSYTQGINNTKAGPILESLAIIYQVNQPANSNLWDSIFAPILIFGID